MRATALLCFALIAPLCHAAAVKVIGIQDCDTLTVLRDGAQVRVRLVDIDAPEQRQDFGTRSCESLAEICHGKAAELAERGQDRYKRVLAQVTCAGVDANAEQVSRGMAWVFVRYAPKGFPLYATEADARAARRGLWSHEAPVPPWEWHQQKPASR